MRIAALLLALAACGDSDPRSFVDAQASPAGASKKFKVISTIRTSILTSAGPFRVVDSVVQNGDNDLDRFRVERVLRENASSLRGAIVLTPGLSLSSRSYEIGDVPGDEGFATSTAGMLAAADLDVYLYTPRAGVLDLGRCLDPASAMTIAGWGIQDRVDDVGYIRGLVAQEHGSRRPIIGGYSLGGAVALATVNQDPDAWAGLIGVDAMLVTDDPNQQQAYATWCDTWEPALATQWTDPAHGAEVAQAFLAADANDPNGPSQIPGFTNHQAYLAVVSQPQPGPPAGVVPQGFYLAAVGAEGLAFASQARLAALLGDLAPCTPLSEMVDLGCHLGGNHGHPFTDHLSAFKGPALVFQLDKGVGRLVGVTFALLGGPTKLVPSPLGFGHTDLFASAQHADLFERPLLAWIAENERLLGWRR